MTTKEKIIQAVQDMPDNASIEDVMERLLFLAKIEKGLEQADAGRAIPHGDVKKKMGKWLK
jgi:predicted transcriptional regulator